jgi:hypothetical protein
LSSSSLFLQFGTPGEQLQLPKATPEGLAPEDLAPRTTQRLRTGSAGLASQQEQVRAAQWQWLCMHHRPSPKAWHAHHCNGPHPLWALQLQRQRR